VRLRTGRRPTTIKGVDTPHPNRKQEERDPREIVGQTAETVGSDEKGNRTLKTGGGGRVVFAFRIDCTF